MATVEERLLKLEKKVDWYRRATMVMALLLVAGVTMGQAKETTLGKLSRFDTVICRQLFVKNDTGIINTFIDSDSSGNGRLTMRSASGKDLVSFTTSDYGMLSVNASDGSTGVGVFGQHPSTDISRDEGGGMVATYSPVGVELVKLTAAAEGGYGAVETFSPKGKRLVMMSATTNGDGGVSTYSPGGKALVDLGATAGGNGTVTTYSPEGNALVKLVATVEDNGTVATYSSNGKQLVMVSATPTGHGGVRTFSPEGRELVTLGATTSGDGGVWTTTMMGTNNRLD